MADLVRSAATYKHEYVTPPRGDHYGISLPTPMSCHNIENSSESQMGSVPPSYSLDDSLPVLDPLPILDTNEHNGFHDLTMVREKEEAPIDSDLYAKGGDSIFLFLFVSVVGLVNTQDP